MSAVAVSQLEFSGRTVDLASGRIGSGAQLRPMESALLRYLAERLGQVVPYEELLTRVWGYGKQVRTNTLHTTLCRLRVALEPDPTAPTHLLTVTGRGLRLVADLPRSERNGVGPADPFVGRSTLLAHLRASPPGVLVVVGPSGVGKTRLVSELLREEEAPGWWIDVSAATTAAEVADRLPAPLDPQGPAWVVLDGADGLEALGPSLVAWARATPARWIVTRRLPVGIEGERRLPVGPLALPVPGAFTGEAAELLTARIRARDPSFDPSGEEAGLGRVLALTDGLPRAIEVAAQQVAVLGPAAARELLQADGSLAETIAPSWDGLSADTRSVLAQLAALSRPFTLPMAARIVAPAPGVPVAQRVAALVEQGLVARSGARFAMLETLRAQVGPPDPEAVARHLAAHVAVADAILSEADGMLLDHPLPIDEADALLDAATRAVPRARDPSLAALFEVAARLAVRVGNPEASAALVDAVLAADPAPHTALRLRDWWSYQLWSAGRYDDARALWARLPAEALREGMPEIAAGAELSAAGEWFNAGQPVQAEAAVQRAERYLAEARLPVRLAAYFRGRVAHVRGCLLTGPDAIETMARAVHEMVASGRPEASARSRGNLAQVLQRAGRISEALRQVRAALDECPAPMRGLRSELLGLAARALRAEHQFEEALAATEQALSLLDGKLPGRVALCLLERGWALVSLGRVSEARADATRARELAERTGHLRMVLLIRRLEATVAFLTGDPDLGDQLASTFEAAAQARVWGVANELAELVAGAWIEGRGSSDPLRLTTLLLEQDDLDTEEPWVALLHAELLRRQGRRQVALAVLEQVGARTTGEMAGILRVARASLGAELGDPDLARTIVTREARIPGAPWAALHRARCARALGDSDETVAALSNVKLRPWEALLRAALAEAAVGLPAGDRPTGPRPG